MDYELDFDDYESAQQYMLVDAADFSKEYNVYFNEDALMIDSDDY